MTLKTATIETGRTGESNQPFRPQLVFSRDDGIGAEARISGKPCIMIVEDDYLIALDVEASLGDAGFVLAGIASTAEEAIIIARSAQPAIALMDIRLLGKRDGIDAALELYRDFGIRCIFATAHADRDVKLRAEAARPLGWVQKPYSTAMLIEAIQRGLQELDNKG
ncbi:response regulator [Mesorhizobium sp. B2-4-9]|uniref:response regulator n=1 Tax=Mesorhizobium sp. B2-4-9 TaxID=2589940 RepID=UPI001FF02739|nr:response regulator [Mesorhizobium sp. B2-4-9]